QDGKVKKDRDLSPHRMIDFKLQPNGLKTYFDYDRSKFFALDSKWNIVDSFSTENYPTDSHELLLLNDGGYVLLGLTYTSKDLTGIIDSGTDRSLLLGNIIQRFDRNKQLIFEWQGIDHYDFHDAI